MLHAVIERCPVCGKEMEVTQLHCHHCDTSIGGHFSLGHAGLGRFYQLTPEQLAFAETFVRLEGRIKKMEKELGVSYPTVRNRLEEVIHALGYELEQEPVRSPEQRKEILEQLAAGEISAEEASRLLKNKG